MANASRLTELLIRRDKVEEALVSGAGYIELQVRGRRVEYEASTKVLGYLNDQIRIEEAKSGPARNKARLRRP